MVFRDFRCVSARAAYRGVKNVDLRPLFLLWREEGFSILRPSQRKNHFLLARNNLCGRICVIYILFGRKYIRRK